MVLRKKRDGSAVKAIQDLRMANQNNYNEVFKHVEFTGEVQSMKRSSYVKCSKEKVTHEFDI